MRILIAILFVLVVFSTNATNKYVAKTGNNSNPGTFESPYLTITKGLESRSAGDTVFVLAGTYQEYVMLVLSGSVGSPIVLKNYGTDVVTIDAQSTREICILGDNISNWVIDGFNLLNATGYNLGLTRCSNIIVKNCTSTLPESSVYATGSSAKGAYIQGQTGGWCSNISLINYNHTGGQYGMLATEYCSNMLIQNSHFN